MKQYNLENKMHAIIYSFNSTGIDYVILNNSFEMIKKGYALDADIKYINNTSKMKDKIAIYFKQIGFENSTLIEM